MKRQMGKVFIPIGIACLWCMGLCTCQSSKQNTGQQTNDSVLTTENRADCGLSIYEPLIHNETYRCDTIVDDLHITYTLQDNDDVVCSYPYVEKSECGTIFMEIDTAYYADQVCMLTIENSDGTIFHLTIDKNFFASFVPRSDLPRYMLHSVRLQQYDIEEKKLYFEVMLCVPDTDICYSFLLIVSAQGEWLVQNEQEDGEAMSSL